MYDLYICLYLRTYSYVDLLFRFANGLKIHDIKWKYEGFEIRSMVLNTSYQISLQNVETDSSEIFPKCWKTIRCLVKYKVKDKKL